MADEITVAQLRELQSSGATFRLVDVRELDEWESGIIEGAELINQNQIYDGSSFDKFTKDENIVLYCRSGRRSLDCANAMHDAGFANAVSLAGGILEWQSAQ